MTKERSSKNDNSDYKASLFGFHLRDVITDMLMLGRNLEGLLRNQNGLSSNVYEHFHIQNFRSEWCSRANLGVELGSVLDPLSSGIVWGYSGGVLFGQTEDLPSSRILSVGYYFSFGGQSLLGELDLEDSKTYFSIFGKALGCQYNNRISNERCVEDGNSIGRWKSWGALAEVGLGSRSIASGSPCIAGIGYIKLQTLRTLQEHCSESSKANSHVFTPSYYYVLNLPIGTGMEFVLNKNYPKNIFSLESVATFRIKRSFLESVIVYKDQMIDVISPKEWDPFIKTDVNVAYRGQINNMFLDLLVSVGSRTNLRGIDCVYGNSYPISCRFATEVAF